MIDWMTSEIPQPRPRHPLGRRRNWNLLFESGKHCVQRDLDCRGAFYDQFYGEGLGHQ
jgi:hypothetical protein